MTKNRYPAMTTSRLFLRGLLTFCSMLILYSLGCSSDHDNSIPVSDSNTSVPIDKTTGGVITCSTQTGLEIVLDIPPNALESSIDVTITASHETTEMTKAVSSSPQPSGSVCTIAIEPSGTTLQKPGTLQIKQNNTTDSVGGMIMVNTSRPGTPYPLKQGVTDNQLSCNIYSFGTFSMESATEADLKNYADTIMDATITPSWQESLKTFNSLLMLSSFFSHNGEIPYAEKCIRSAISICKNNAVFFLETPPPSGDDQGYRTHLKMHRHILTLCDNPENLVSLFDKRLSEFNPPL